MPPDRNCFRPSPIVAFNVFLHLLYPGYIPVTFASVIQGDIYRQRLEPEHSYFAADKGQRKNTRTGTLL